MKNVTGKMRTMVTVLAGILSAVMMFPHTVMAASLPSPSQMKFTGVYLMTDGSRNVYKTKDSYNVRDYLDLDDSKILAIRCKDGNYEVLILDGLDCKKDIILKTPEEQAEYGLKLESKDGTMVLMPAEESADTAA